MKITGAKAQIFLDSFNSSSMINGTGSNTTVAKQKYFVIGKGAGSNIPVIEGSFFQAPVTGSQITLVTGDRLFAITPERFCKTTASLEMSTGEVDISTDCAPGAKMSDGIVTFSGSIATLFDYNEATGEFENVTDMIVNRFLDIVEDNGNGQYTLHPKSDSTIYMLTLLNSGGSIGKIENWLFSPITITSMSMSLGNADPQNQDLSFSKGDGQAILYKVPSMG